MTSIFGIAGVAGGGGMGLTSLLMNNSGKFEFNVGPEVKSEKYSESAEDVERKGYKYARDSSRLAAVFIYREQEKSGEDDQPICNYWIDTAAIKDGTLGNMDKGECLEIINSSGKGINLEKPFKFAKAEQKHMSNIIRRFFKSSIEGELPWEKYSLTDSEWTFNNEWLCNNSREENENIEVVSCQKLGQEELKKEI